MVVTAQVDSNGPNAVAMIAKVFSEVAFVKYSSLMNFSDVANLSVKKVLASPNANFLNNLIVKMYNKIDEFTEFVLFIVSC